MCFTITSLNETNDSIFIIISSIFGSIKYEKYNSGCGDNITYKKTDKKIMDSIEELIREKGRTCVTIKELHEKTSYHPRTIIEHLDLAKCHGAGDFDDDKIMFCINKRTKEEK